MMRITVLGDNRVGKSALISRFVDRHKVPRESLTVGIDVSCTSISVFRQDYHMQLIELSNLIGYESLYKQYLVNSVGSVVVFDITDHSSFKRAFEYIDKIRIIHDDTFPIILVGNTCIGCIGAPT